MLLEPALDGGMSRPRQLSDAGDAASNRMLLHELAQHRPGDAVLSEESTDDPARLRGARVWIIDPLDGSREFGMPGRSDWAVHVALWQVGRGITDAAVSQPALGRGLRDRRRPCRAAPHAAAGSRWSATPGRRPSPPTPPPRSARRVEPMGSAGAKAMAVVRGDAAAYVHAGGQWEWDSAAPVGVALAAGLHASRIDGTPLRYNQAHPYLPDLLICAPGPGRPPARRHRRIGPLAPALR